MFAHSTITLQRPSAASDATDCIHMSKLSIGIVGLPNVGKSTLFRALTAISVPAENYPFCTIDPNVGVVEVPDPRLHRIAALVKPGRVVPNVVEFVDIAGLVAGASKGEGLGNKFLQHIREVDAICHVVRCFEDPAIVATGAPGDPNADRSVVELELSLADLEVVERALDKAERRERTGDAEAAVFAGVLRRIRIALSEGQPARRIALSPDELRLVKSLNLLTRKPAMYVANVSEDDAGGGSAAARQVREAVAMDDPAAAVVTLSAQLEADLLALENDEREEYLAAHEMTESGLGELIRAGYRLLGLTTFFTVGENEVRAWTVRSGTRAPEAAGMIHTDFERGFIRAETIHVDEFVGVGSLKNARDAGRMRLEGKEYEVADGDIITFRSAT
jgi:GTP-binding protein YchF